MSKIKKITIIFISLCMLLAISTQSYAALTSVEWIDKETGIKFDMITSSTGKVTARAVSSQTIQSLDAYLAAKERANAKAQEMEKKNASSNTGNNGEELKLEITQTEETETEKILPKIKKSISEIKDKGDLAWGSNALCIDQAGVIAEARNNKISVQGHVIDIESVTRDGIVIGQGNIPKNIAKIMATNASGAHESVFGYVKADPIVKNKTREVLGETYDTAALAYIYSRVNDPKDNGNALDNAMQGATWKEDYYKTGSTYNVEISKPLSEEANQYKAYRKEVEEFKRANQGKLVTYKIEDNTIATDISKKEGKMRTCYNKLC